MKFDDDGREWEYIGDISSPREWRSGKIYVGKPHQSPEPRRLGNSPEAEWVDETATWAPGTQPGEPSHPLEPVVVEFEASRRVWPWVLMVATVIVATAAIVLAIWWFGPEQSAKRYCQDTATRADQVSCMTGRGFAP